MGVKDSIRLKGVALPRAWNENRPPENSYQPLSFWPTSCSATGMLWTIAIILIILWLLGFVSSYTMGGFIHILLVIAVIVIVVRLIQGRKVL